MTEMRWLKLKPGEEATIRILPPENAEPQYFMHYVDKGAQHATCSKNTCPVCEWEKKQKKPTGHFASFIDRLMNAVRRFTTK